MKNRWLDEAVELVATWAVIGLLMLLLVAAVRSY